MGFHGVEITIIVKQSQPLDDTKSCDDDIDCFPHGNTRFSKGSVIPGTLDSDIVSPNLAEWESAKEAFGCFEILG
jgi:hypothetical protein